MKKRLMSIPEGTRDILFSDCECKRRVERLLKEVYVQAGYNEIITPSLEYLDVFTEKDSVAVEEMYKLVDGQGRIMVLRPDSTTPIARIAASRLRDHPVPLRFHYTQNIFRTNMSQSGRRSEITQSGVELLGVGGIRADLEVIRTAVLAMQACGIGRFKLELGHVGFFKELMSEIDFSEEDYESVRACIEYKNYASLNDILERYPGGPASEALKRLPRLFGDGEVLAEASSITGGKALKPVEYLEKLMKSLGKLGLSDCISIDLGLVHHLDYYTGLVFSCYAEGSGEPVMSGGRYDGLACAFGADLPAIGFAVNVDAVAECLGPTPEKAAPDILVHYKSDSFLQAVAFQKEQQIAGKTCELSLYSRLEETRANAAARGIPVVAVLDGNRTELQRLV